MVTVALTHVPQEGPLLQHLVSLVAMPVWLGGIWLSNCWWVCILKKKSPQGAHPTVELTSRGNTISAITHVPFFCKGRARGSLSFRLLTHTRFTLAFFRSSDVDVIWRLRCTSSVTWLASASCGLRQPTGCRSGPERAERWVCSTRTPSTDSFSTSACLAAPLTAPSNCAGSLWHRRKKRCPCSLSSSKWEWICKEWGKREA